MSLNRPSWLMPALTIIVTMAVFGGVMLYLNPDRASALEDTAPAASSLAVAAEKTNTCASICRSGSNACISASACTGGSCTVEECVDACENAGVTCSQECIEACTKGACTGSGNCSVDGQGACTLKSTTSRGSGCCGK